MNNKTKLAAFTHRVLVTVGVVTAVILTLLLFWQAAGIAFIVFAGILAAVFLHGISNWLHQRLPIPRKGVLILVVLLLAVILVAGGWLLAPSLIEQGEQLSTSLSTSIQDLREHLSRYQWIQDLLNQAPNVQQMVPQPRDMLSRITGVFSRTLDVITRTVILLFISFYLAYDPDLYLRGVLKLVPPSRRQRAGEVLDELGHTLRWWLVGRLASMTIVGILSIVGLELLGVPLAFILGFLAGLLAFIPLIGPTLALLPPVLIAFANSPQQALYVFLLYMGIQVVESYIITPVIQKRAVSLPPVLTIVAQVVLALFLGLLGIMMASPLAAASMVLVKMLYIEDVLGDGAVMPVPGSEASSGDAASPLSRQEELQPASD